MPRKVILDIESVGVAWDCLSSDTQEYLLKDTKTEAEEEKVKKQLPLWAPTSKLVVIGLLNPDTHRAMIISEGSPSERPIETQHGNLLVSHFQGDEPTMLAKFWELMPSYNLYITFNGKGFDCPFIMLRSLIQKVIPTRQLDTRRFTTRPHLDLLEVLSYFGALRKFTLSFWCQTLGIENPKTQFGDGTQVQQAYHQGRMNDIIEYNLADLVATAQLFKFVDKYLLNVWEKK